jgi:hypothetical protein
MRAALARIQIRDRNNASHSEPGLGRVNRFGLKCAPGPGEESLRIAQKERIPVRTQADLWDLTCRSQRFLCLDRLGIGMTGVYDQPGVAYAFAYS